MFVEVTEKLGAKKRMLIDVDRISKIVELDDEQPGCVVCFKDNKEAPLKVQESLDTLKDAIDPNSAAKQLIKLQESFFKSIS